MEKTMNRKTFLSALVLNGLVAAAAATLSMAPAPVRADDEPPAGCDYKQCSSPSACELALDRTNCLQLHADRVHHSELHRRRRRRRDVITNLKRRNQ